MLSIESYGMHMQKHLASIRQYITAPCENYGLIGSNLIDGQIQCILLLKKKKNRRKITLANEGPNE